MIILTGVILQYSVVYWSFDSQLAVITTLLIKTKRSIMILASGTLYFDARCASDAYDLYFVVVTTLKKYKYLFVFW